MKESKEGRGRRDKIGVGENERSVYWGSAKGA